MGTQLFESLCETDGDDIKFPAMTKKFQEVIDTLWHSSARNFLKMTSDLGQARNFWRGFRNAFTFPYPPIQLIAKKDKIGFCVTAKRSLFCVFYLIRIPSDIF